MQWRARLIQNGDEEYNEVFEMVLLWVKVPDQCMHNQFSNSSTVSDLLPLQEGIQVT